MSDGLLPQQRLSALDKIDKRLAELDFSEFIRQAGAEVLGRFVWGNHLGVMARHLQAAAEGKIDRLLINVPPSCTKSTVISVLWPAWVWIHEPDAGFLCVTYNQDLTVRDAVACRRLIGSEWYQSRWGERVRVEFGSDAKVFYRLVGGGWRLSTTRAGRATGDHPKYIVIDDPLSAEKAKNANERKAFSDWTRDTLPSRGIAKKAAHVIGMQRLHPEDPSADCIRENELAIADGYDPPWHHVMLPMRFDPERAMPDRGFGGDWRTVAGELLYPELLDEQMVVKLERRLGSVSTAAQLQQHPKLRDGDFFMITRMKIVKSDDAPREFDAVCRFWDRAASDESGAYTAGALVARKGSRFWLLHMIRKRLTAGEVENLIETTMFLDERLYGVGNVITCFEIEGGSSGVRVAEITLNRLRGHNVYGVRSIHSKEMRAGPLQIAIENEEVSVIDGPWVPETLEEMGMFPTGTYKDQTDAFAGAYLELVNPSKKRKTVVMSGDESDAPRPSTEGKCQNAACKRPAFGKDGHCCEACARVSPEGEECVQHTPECAATYNDWYIKHSR